jgi:hypothetical protein
MNPAQKEIVIETIKFIGKIVFTGPAYNLIARI